jgi:hypothetical protein
MFCTFTLVLSLVFVQCPIWPSFCCFLILCFPSMLPGYFMKGFEMVPVARIITAVTFVSYVPHALYL